MCVYMPSKTFNSVICHLQIHHDSKGTKNHAIGSRNLNTTDSQPPPLAAVTRVLLNLLHTCVRLRPSTVAAMHGYTSLLACMIRRVPLL